MQGAKERLMRAATDLLKEEGIYALTLNRILAKSGVSKGGFFHHFPTKDALVRELLVTGDRAFQQEIRHIRLSGAGETEARVRASINRLRDKDSFALILVAATDSSLTDEIRTYIQESVLSGVEEGLSPVQARTVLLALQGLYLERVLGIEHADEDLSQVQASLLSMIGVTETEGLAPPNSLPELSEFGYIAS